MFPQVATLFVQVTILFAQVSIFFTINPYSGNVTFSQHILLTQIAILLVQAILFIQINVDIWFTQMNVSCVHYWSCFHKLKMCIQDFSQGSCFQDFGAVIQTSDAVMQDLPSASYTINSCYCTVLHTLLGISGQTWTTEKLQSYKAWSVNLWENTSIFQQLIIPPVLHNKRRCGVGGSVLNIKHRRRHYSKQCEQKLQVTLFICFKVRPMMREEFPLDKAYFMPLGQNLFFPHVFGLQRTHRTITC